MARRWLVPVAVLLLPVVMAAPAAAKGPRSATITGPGLDAPVHVGEQDVGTLGEATGAWPAMFRQSPNPLRPHRPAHGLGPRLRIAYRVSMPVRGGRERAFTIVQSLYPRAHGAPVTYTAPGQPLFGGKVSLGGWYLAPNLASALEDAGVHLAAISQAQAGVGGSPASKAQPASTRSAAAARPQSSSTAYAWPLGVGAAALALLTAGFARARAARRRS